MKGISQRRRFNGKLYAVVNWCSDNSSALAVAIDFSKNEHGKILIIPDNRRTNSGFYICFRPESWDN